MLVATPGQTTAYHPTLHGSSSSSNNSSSAPKQICHSSSSNSTSSSTAAVVAKSTLNSKLPAESSARSGSGNASGGNGTTSSLMKTLSVRLNRGTEFLKGTVQKALISTTNITTNTTTIPNSNNNNNNNNNNNTTNTTTTTTTNSHSDINIINPNKAVTATAAAATTTTTSSAKTTALTHVSSSSSIIANRPSVGTSSGVSAATANVVRSSNSGNSSSSHNLSTNVTTSRVIAAASSTGCSATTRLKLYTVPPTVIHRHPEERLRTSSVDSLHKEMCHFKPIRAAPTTPLKSCTKSRGVSLKTPKANLATKINLHANCDVSKIWVEQEGSGSESDQQLDESNLYKHLKPKPSSTVLTTIISTPTHQSAFVCLVAQMKNISTDSSSKGSLNKMNVHKPRADRGRRKSTGRKTGRGKSIATVGTVTRQKVSLHKGRNPFVHVKKLHLPADLIISRTIRAAREAKKGLSALQPRTPTTTPPPMKSAKRGNAGKTRNGKTRSQVALNKGRPRGKIAPDIKEVTGVNIIEHKNRGKPATGGMTNTTATTANVGGGGAGENRRRVRKRKILDLTEADEGAQPMARKSARISKDCNNDASSSSSSATATATAAGLAAAAAMKSPTKTTAATKSPMKISATGNKGKRATGNASKRGRGSRHTTVTSSRVSPPLTRARLKQMSNGKLLTALDY